VPPSSLRLALGDSPPGTVPRGQAPRDSAPGGHRKWSPGSLNPGARRPRSSSPSWWTARATTGAVTPGFSKAEILKPPKEDPLAEGGLFDRVGGLLEELGPGTISH
jgi:hypothetical protein